MGQAAVKIYPEYIPALKALDGFSHVNIFWWFSKSDFDEAKNILEAPQPYKNW